MDRLPANLQSIGDARLPEVYANAKVALQACVKLDECQTWANKAEAMASYARQSEDDEMRKMADRIQARAVKRCGALLQEIKPSPGRQKESGGTLPRFSRTQAARDAGMSDDQRKNALRVAKIPDAEFESAVEGDNPPTVTALAEQGTVKKLAVNAAAAAKAKPGDNPAAALIDLIEHFERINVSVTVARTSNDDRITLMTQLARANACLNKTAVEIAISGGANLGKLAPVSLRLEALEFLKAATARIEAELAGRAVATPGAAA
jgi:hypothetical protein